jgi:hypothetical protein
MSQQKGLNLINLLLFSLKNIHKKLPKQEICEESTDEMSSEDFPRMRRKHGIKL